MNAMPPLQAPVMTERRVGLIGALLVAVGPVSMALFTPAMPEIVRAYGTTEAAVKMTLSLYFAGFAIAQLVAGPLSDGYGRRPVTVAFMVLYLAASVLAFLAPTVEVLIAARLLQGAGAAVGVAIARAIVRDLFTGDRAARIMNLTGMILAVGPAFAPTVGGLTLEVAGWRAIFALMVVLGLAAIAVAHFCLVETVARDPSRIRPGALARSYAMLLGNGYFMLSSLVVAGTVGAIYTQATVIPFVLMDRVGLTPTQFGFGMLMQSGSFFAGTLAVRSLMRRMRAARLVAPGIALVALGSVCLAVLMRIAPPGFLSVMGPIAIYAFGVAFVMPAMTVAAMASFPRSAGAASALTGFMQMGAGVLGGSVAALIGEPVTALATIIPGMGALALVSWLVWRRLPEPAIEMVRPRA